MADEHTNGHQRPSPREISSYLAYLLGTNFTEEFRDLGERPAYIPTPMPPFASPEPVATSARPMQAQPMHAVPMQAQPMHAVSMQAQPMHAVSIPAQPMHAVPMQAQPMHADSMRAELMRAHSMQVQPMHAVSMQTQSMHADSMRAHSMNADSMRAELMRAYSMQAQPMHSVPIQDQPMHAVPMQDQPMHAVPMQSQPMRNNSMRNNSMLNNWMRNNSMRAAQNSSGQNNGIVRLQLIRDLQNGDNIQSQQNAVLYAPAPIEVRRFSNNNNNVYQNSNNNHNVYRNLNHNDNNNVPRNYNNHSLVPPQNRPNCCCFCYGTYTTMARKNGWPIPQKDDFGAWSLHRCVENRIVTCPKLRTIVCGICGATGDDAHTTNYHITHLARRSPPRH